jgi:hypothetical protein
MGREIARELGVVEDAVYYFKSGEKPFPKEKLATLPCLAASGSCESQKIFWFYDPIPNADETSRLT